MDHTVNYLRTLKNIVNQPNSFHEILLGFRCGYSSGDVVLSELMTAVRNLKFEVLMNLSIMLVPSNLKLKVNGLIGQDVGQEEAEIGSSFNFHCHLSCQRFCFHNHNEEK